MAQLFLSTLSLRRATIISQHGEPDSGNFYPRSPCGERRGVRLNFFIRIIFLSTLSLRRATAAGRSCYLDNIISIHALLAESDDTSKDTIKTVINFYPRSPCGERRTTIITICTVSRFLSTLSLRRATTYFDTSSIDDLISIHALLAESDQKFPCFAFQQSKYFYPRSPCGERQSACCGWF